MCGKCMVKISKLGKETSVKRLSIEWQKGKVDEASRVDKEWEWEIFREAVLTCLTLCGLWRVGVQLVRKGTEWWVEVELQLKGV